MSDDIGNGTALISGRSRERARQALAAAEAVGLEASVVRTTEGGYLVPEAVAQYIEGTWKDEAEAPVEAESPTVGEVQPPVEEKPAPKPRRSRKKKSEDTGSEGTSEDKKE